MKQVNINGDLIYISDAEYEETEKQQLIIDSLGEKGWKNEVQKKVRIKIATKKARKLADAPEKAKRKDRTKPEREE